MLRYLTIPQIGRHRVALEDIEIGGATIRAGESVICPLDIANRDPEIFPNPDHARHQSQPPHNIAFGFGVHQCLGQRWPGSNWRSSTARSTAAIPTLRLATDIEQIPFKDEAVVYGVHELPSPGETKGERKA